jgi:hypothetical protein
MTEAFESLKIEVRTRKRDFVCFCFCFASKFCLLIKAVDCILFVCSFVVYCLLYLLGRLVVYSFVAYIYAHVYIQIHIYISTKNRIVLHRPSS